MKKVKFLITTLIAVVLILESINVYLANTLATNSIYVSTLQTKIQEIDSSNLVLSTKILGLASYETVASRASQLGFNEPKDTIVLFSPPQVAFGR